MLTKVTKEIQKGKELGFFHFLSANYIVQMFGFLSTVTVSKILAPAELGAIKVMQSYTDVVAVLSSLGLSAAVLKFCSEKNTDKDYILRKSHICGLIGSFVGILSLNFLCYINENNESGIVNDWLILYSVIIFATVSTNISISYFQAVRKFKQLALRQVVIKFINIIVILVMTYYYGLSGYIITFIIGVYITAIFFLPPLKKCIRFNVANSMPTGFWKLAITSMTANSIGIIAYYADIFLLNRFFDNTVIGYYTIAIIFLMIGKQFIASIQSFITPFFSNHDNDGKWIIDYTFKYQVKTSAMVGLLSVAIYIFVYFLVNIYYGESYWLVVEFMPYLLIQNFLYSCYAVMGSVLLAINHNKYNIYTGVLNLALKIFVLLFLIDKYGVEGLLWGKILIEIPIIFVEYYFFRRTIKEIYSI